MQVPALIQKHLYTKQLPRIAILKAVCRFVVLLHSTFCSFFFFIVAAGFFFTFGNFVHHCVVFLNAPLSDRDYKNKKKKRCQQWVFFPGKSWSIVSDVRRSCCPIGSRFQVGGEIIAWLFANPYELKSRIWVGEEYNHFEWIYGVCRCDRFLTMTNESVSVNFDICPVATIYTTRLAYF